MAITFFTQSKKETAQIYIRIREGRGIDAKARTKYYIDPIRFDKGKIRFYKTPNGTTAEIKKGIKESNRTLIDLEKYLNDLRLFVLSEFNNRKEYEIINSNWLKRIVNPSITDVPNSLTGYFDLYFKEKKSSLKPSTVKKLRTIQSRLKNYESEKDLIYIIEVHRKFKKQYSIWSDQKGYAHNTKVKTIKVVSMICKHAKENGIKTHPDLEILTNGLKYKPTPHVFLSLLEIEQIKRKELSARLDIARDWLIISCFTAQRVSDFLKFTKDDITEIEGCFFLDINQEKTGTPVYIPLNEIVLDIMEKYNGNFPPSFSDNPESNEVIYNRLIKTVCQLAGINEVVKANLRQTKTNRYEIKEVPKWKAVSSHIGRRSFATNYYGKINTALLISATGHATEKQFLTYVGKKPQSNAIELAREMRRIATDTSVFPNLKLVED